MDMAYHRYGSRDPKVKLVRAHSYLTDNAIIDDFGPKIGAHGVAVYHALNRFADRQTGECWPKIKKIGAKLRLSESSVKRTLHVLKAVGLITIDPRWSEDGDRTSNLYTLIPVAMVAERQQEAARTLVEAMCDGGGSTVNPPPPAGETEVGSAGTLSEQDSLNNISPNIADAEKTNRSNNTCTHPAPEVSRFDGITICHHCWSILEEDLIGAENGEVQKYPDASDTSQAA
jgi:predicted transcriptional regulator